MRKEEPWLSDYTFHRKVAGIPRRYIVLIKRVYTWQVMEADEAGTYFPAAMFNSEANAFAALMNWPNVNQHSAGCTRYIDADHKQHYPPSKQRGRA